jgi:hypothetical protein
VLSFTFGTQVALYEVKQKKTPAIKIKCKGVTNMNAIRDMYYTEYAAKIKAKRSNLHLVKDEYRKEECVTVNGKTMTKYELNEKLAYFYENGGPVMDI